MSQRIVVDGVDLTDLLNVKAEDVKEPVPLPIGDYPAVFTECKGLKIAKSENKTPYVRYAVMLRDWPASVPEEHRYNDGKAVNLADRSKNLTKDFYMSEDSQIIFVRLLQELGLAPEGRSLPELFPVPIGVPLVAQIVHQVSQKNGRTYAVVGEIFPMR